MTEFECNLPIVIKELQDKTVELEAKDVELQNQINNEVLTRANADDQLQANIDAEIIARINADEAESSTRAGVDQDLQEQIDALKNSLIPYGAVQYFARDTAPEGWLIADGSAISRIEYANLFTAIGTNFGVGDGTETFNLPDLRGEFIRGWVIDREGVMGESGLRAFGSWQADDFKSHNHPISNGSYGFSNPAIINPPTTLATYSTGVGGGFGSTVASQGGTETRPRNVALLACIKY